MRKSILKYSLYEVKITTNNIAILRLFPSLVVKNCNNLITTFSLSTVMGVLGEVTLNKNLFHAEVRGLTQFLSQTMCETYLPHCRTNLGDQRCKFNLDQENFTVQAVVTEVIDQQTFIVSSLTQANNWFTYGYISWQSGKNLGLKMEVKNFINSRITLVLPMPFVINIGDEFTIVAGCDKASRTCIEKFNNIINFRGEPDLPGIDKLSNKL